jgi:endoglucanase
MEITAHPTKKLMVEVHYYDPFNFTLNENTNIVKWGKDATDPSKTFLLG